MRKIIFMNEMLYTISVLVKLEERWWTFMIRQGGIQSPWWSHKPGYQPYYTSMLKYKVLSDTENIILNDICIHHLQVEILGCTTHNIYPNVNKKVFCIWLIIIIMFMQLKKKLLPILLFSCEFFHKIYWLLHNLPHTLMCKIDVI